MTNMKSETIARTIVLALALINQCLAMAGRGTIDIAESEIYQIVSLAFTCGASVWAWWKNNSFTKEAIQADKIMHLDKLNRKGKV